MHILIPGLQASIVLQSIIFTFFMISNQRVNLLPSKLVMLLMGILSTQMIFNLINQHLSSFSLPNIVFGFGMFYGPIVYLYLKAMMYADFYWRKRYLFHFFPGILLSLTAVMTQVSANLGAAFIFVSIGGYLLVTISSYLKFRRVIKHTQSAEDHIAMSWAAMVLVINGIVLTINIVSVILAIQTGKSQWYALSEMSLFVMLMVMLNIFLLKGLSQPLVFNGISQEDETITEASHENGVANVLEPAICKRIEQHLSAYMCDKRPFLDPMFSLQALARKLGESPRNLSIYINQHLESNFADFVNQYRLAEVKTHLIDTDDKRTFIDIAYASGFSTKSNFNRAFKKHEGITPSEFKRRG